MRKTTADQHPHGALRVYRIPPEKKKTVSCIPAEYRREISLSVEIQTPPEQHSPEHPFSKQQLNSAEGASFFSLLLQHYLKGSFSSLKINVQRDCTNFRSIQEHHLQSSPISLDYPFKWW
jgi:hypothetical protein